MELAREIRKRNRFVSEAHFFLDNSSVVDGFLGEAPVLSQGEFLEFQRLAKNMAPCKVFVSWIPKHKDIPGNETADRLAKKARVFPPPKSVTAPSRTSSDGREVSRTGMTICQKATVDGNLMPQRAL